MYLKLKALCSLTKCFIVIGLIRFLLSSSRCYRGLEAVVGNQSSRAQTLSRWDQLTVIWFQNTLPEEADNGHPATSQEPVASAAAAAAAVASSPAEEPPHLSCSHPPSQSPALGQQACVF